MDLLLFHMKILKYFQIAENHLSQCIQALKYEPSHCAEGKLVERAKEEHRLLLEYIDDLESESK